MITGNDNFQNSMNEEGHEITLQANFIISQRQLSKFFVERHKIILILGHFVDSNEKVRILFTQKDIKLNCRQS